MKKDNKNVVPIIVNGELNAGNRRRKRRQESLPQKTFNFGDIVLTLIGLILIGYGVYGLINKDTDKKVENKTSNKVEENNKIEEIKFEEYIILNAEESLNVYSKEDLSAMALGLNSTNLSNNAKLSLGAKLTNKHTVGTETYILEEDMDNSIKNLFGNITYNKESFTYGNNIYTYSQENKMYYLMTNTKPINPTYQKYNYIEKEQLDNKLIIREYVVYTSLDNTKSWTLNNGTLTEVIIESNIKEKYKLLKYYEYEFTKNNNQYNLNKITIK